MSTFGWICVLLLAPCALVPLDALARRWMCRRFGHVAPVVLQGDPLEVRCTRCGRQERFPLV